MPALVQLFIVLQGWERSRNWIADEAARKLAKSNVLQGDKPSIILFQAKPAERYVLDMETTARRLELRNVG